MKFYGKKWKKLIKPAHNYSWGGSKPYSWYDAYKWYEGIADNNWRQRIERTKIRTRKFLNQRRQRLKYINNPWARRQLRNYKREFINIRYPSEITMNAKKRHFRKYITPYVRWLGSHPYVEKYQHINKPYIYNNNNDYFK